MPGPRLDPKVRALQLNLEELFKLLGGTPDDRERFFEILKGITTPAQFRLVSQQLATNTILAKQIQGSLRNLQAEAKVTSASKR